MITGTDLKYITRVNDKGEAELPESKRKIFISYRKKDNEFNLLQRVAKYILKSYDCAIWYDASLTPGENYDDEISTALKDCDAVILLLTRNVMSSDYIWNKEIKQAIEYKKGIIPIALGLDTNDYNKVTDKVGNIHILSAEKLFMGELKQKEYEMAEKEFIDTLYRSLSRFIINQNIAKRVSDFFATKKNKLPFKYLTVEQIYLFAYGLLNGLNVETNVEKAVSILESLVNLYFTDEETKELNGNIAFDLMLYYIKNNNIEIALEYGNKAIQSNCIQASNYLGQLYWKGDFVDLDKEKAFEYFLIGAKQDKITSLRLVIKMLLSCTNSQEKYEELQYYYERAAICGEEIDVLNLLAFYWNTQNNNAIIPLCKKYNKLSKVFERLMSESNVKGYMEVLECTYRSHFEDCVQMCELYYNNHIFELYKEKTGSNKSDVMLVCDKKAIIYTQNCVWGWGECPTFDLYVEDNFLCLKVSDFDHYEIETMNTIMKMINPSEKNIITLSCCTNWEKGRHDLKFSAYMR